MDKRIYLTTPIYYVNSHPHIGHAYTTIVCDVVRRYYRLLGFDTYFLTGTDEHGDKVMRAAEKNGETPQAYVDRISAEFRDLWPQLSIAPDDFIRTTEERHKKVVREILQKLYDQGEIYFERYGGQYCVGCERFYTKTELADSGGVCPDHRTPLTYIEEENYFFRMSKYQDWLIDRLRSNPDFVRPERYRNELLSFLAEPLRDLCISRPVARLPWGIPLPFDENFVTYVWFDALVNYASALGWPDGELFRRYWPVAEHYIAKDILKPHAVYWPTMLHAAGTDIYKHLNVHGYWKMGEMKMSKSLGNVASPLDLIKIYGVDALRYFLLREMVFGLDADFDVKSFNDRYNSNLADDLGNLVSRLTAMIGRYCEGRVPPAHSLEPGDRALLGVVEAVVANLRQWLDDLKYHHLIEETLQAVRAINRYVNDNEPWKRAKQGNQERVETILHVAARAAVIALQILTPVMPSKTAEALSWFGIEGQADGGIDLDALKPGSPVTSGQVLFPKIKIDEPEESQPEPPKAEEPAPSPAAELPPLAPEITFDDFAKLDLRVAKILEAKRVEGADKLVHLKIDLGFEHREIVAGIAKAYAPEQLVGQTIIVVANLAPRKLRGLTSQGMLLAAHAADGLHLLTTDAPCNPGAKVS
jgi:methionyl-tRNA synthetase